MKLANTILFCLIIPLVMLTTSVWGEHRVPMTKSQHYHLAISFDLQKQQLTGTTQITLPPQTDLTLYTGSLTVTGILIKTADGRTYTATPPGKPEIVFSMHPQEREIFISYTTTINNHGLNLISEDGITLLGNWHPVPDRKMTFTLDASLPYDFTAIVEADSFPLTQKAGISSASFSEPVYSLHFAAAPYIVNSLQVRKDLKVYSLFFKEDHELAESYLAKARTYILRYEKEIGPFPYNHYVIVANKNPTGLGIKTFTLLGQAVLRLPFIKDTSLGHEVLHSWFGNSVEVDLSQGNWSEGLTSYLADHAYLNDIGQGVAYRKVALSNYHSYINDSNGIPLGEFRGVSHGGMRDRVVRAVGYSRSLMLFHELHQRVGAKNFFRSLQQFYSRYRGNEASWQDLQNIFSEVTGKDLKRFFTERLAETELPNVTVSNVQVKTAASTRLTVEFHQTTKQPYSLLLPIAVTTSEGQQMFSRLIENEKERVTLELAARPVSFTLDPNSDLFRELTPEETPASWSRFLGGQKKLAILESEEARARYQPFLDTLNTTNLQVKLDSEVNNAELADNNLLFLGLNQKAATSLFGAVDTPKNGLSLDVRQNPLNQDQVAVLLTSSSQSETQSAAYRLSHYGKYSYLHFKKGRISNKKTPNTASGITFTMETLPIGGAVQPLQDFHSLAKVLSENDVIYVGENHTSLSDHRLQLRLIEAIHKQHPKIAIGMEMFPATSQPALDSYTLQQELTEKDFLKASDYYQVWRYDFRYFQEIFNYAKKHRIPVVGLNLERSIVSNVFRNGHTDDLSDQIKQQLPQERNLDLVGYTERLRAMHSIHMQGNHGSGKASGFIQAQGLWDETMAENIVNYLNNNPDTKMIVLAGSQHTRKDSGIPPRVVARKQLNQASVLNILNGSTPIHLNLIADYFFLAEPLQLPKTGKFGIILEEKDINGKTQVVITDFTETSKAKDGGLKPEDIITAIDGFPIHTMGDIAIAMFDSAIGEKLSITVARGSNEITSHEYQIELIAPQAPRPHP